MTTYSNTFPHRLDPIANGSHGHWSKKAKLPKAGREFGYLAATITVPASVRNGAQARFGRCDVIITRSGPRRMDIDNLYACCKGVIDGVAKAFGVDDGSEWWHWRCEQEKGAYGVRISVALLAAKDGSA